LSQPYEADISPEISVVIPARNESENLAILIVEIAAALEKRAYEIVVVDDGSTDDTGALLARLKIEGLPVRHVRHDRSAGQSAAVRSGMWVARGTYVATIDGDGQNDPRYIPELVDALKAAGPKVGIACGQRLKRQDTISKKLASKLGNGIRQMFLKDNTRDTGCGLKVLPAALFRQLPFFDGWHRYLPALVLREGLGATHVDVLDRPRRFGKSNYNNLDRALRGIADIRGVLWLRKRRKVVPAVTEISLDR
jgi:glycosyltransferase involved in cell wall biosynthesis